MTNVECSSIYSAKKGQNISVVCLSEGTRINQNDLILDFAVLFSQIIFAKWMLNEEKILMGIDKA